MCRCKGRTHTCGPIPHNRMCFCGKRLSNDGSCRGCRGVRQDAEGLEKFQHLASLFGSIAEVSRATGRPYRTIQGWLRGDRGLSPDNADRMAMVARDRASELIVAAEALEAQSMARRGTDGSGAARQGA